MQVLSSEKGETGHMANTSVVQQQACVGNQVRFSEETCHLRKRMMPILWHCMQVHLSLKIWIQGLELVGKVQHMGPP